MKKERIDKLLVAKGLADSRTKAQAMVMAGVVLVNEKRVEKASTEFLPDAVIRVKESPAGKYVGKGGIKLEHALTEFNIRPHEYVCLDVGSSTGGFTDCLLQHGAKKVYAVDVGTNQLAWKLRTEPRVVVRENVNARYLTEDDFEEKFDLIVIDVSFISLTKILGALKTLMKDDGRLIALIKPQFEVGKGEVGKGGVVKDASKHRQVITTINEFAADIGLRLLAESESPVTGAAGNREFLALYERV